MLRTRTVLPTLATRLAFQIGASVAATLIASAIFAVIPKPDAGVVAPAQASAELTSGGKYAARVPGAVPDVAAVEMRDLLPVLTRVASQPLAADTLPDVRTLDTARPAEPSFRPARSRPRPSVARLDQRKTAAPTPALEPAPAPLQLAAAEPAKTDDGFMPRVTSAARSAWSFTTSTSSSLLAHVLP